MSKSKSYSIKSLAKLKRQIKTTLDNKYYDLWFSKYESDLDPRVFHYLMKKFWESGTIAGFKVKHTDELGVAPYVTQSYDTYDFPATCSLVNVRNSPIIPSGQNLVVNKDVVIGYCQSNHKSIKFIVDSYIDRILEVEMVINTQLETHKLPFLIGISSVDEERARDIVDKIKNNEPVIFMSLDDLNLVKTLTNSNPYIMDKLVEHKQQIECELLTFLGLDNAVSQKVNLDITNANNSLINAFKSDIDSNIQNFVDDCSEYLGITFYLRQREQEVQSVYEEGNSELENNTNKEGVVGDHD